MIKVLVRSDGLVFLYLSQPMMYWCFHYVVATLVILFGTAVKTRNLARLPTGYPQGTLAALSQGQVAKVVTWIASKNRNKAPKCSPAYLTCG